MPTKPSTTSGTEIKNVKEDKDVVRRMINSEAKRAKRNGIEIDLETKTAVLKIAMEMVADGTSLEVIAKAARRGFGYKLPTDG